MKNTNTKNIPPIDEFFNTDNLAKMFIDYYILAKQRTDIFRFTDGLWGMITTKNVFDLIKNDFVQYLLNYVSIYPNNDIYVNTINKLFITYNSIDSFISIIVTKLKDISELADSLLNIITFNNGIYMYKYKKFDRIKVDYYLTLSTKYNYNDKVNNEIKNNIVTYLKNTFNNNYSKIINLLARTLISSNSIINNKLNVNVFIGSKLNLSILIKLISGTFGDYYVEKYDNSLSQLHKYNQNYLSFYRKRFMLTKIENTLFFKNNMQKIGYVDIYVVTTDINQKYYDDIEWNKIFLYDDNLDNTMYVKFEQQTYHTEFMNILINEMNNIVI